MISQVLPTDSFQQLKAVRAVGAAVGVSVTRAAVFTSGPSVHLRALGFPHYRLRNRVCAVGSSCVFQGTRRAPN
jgi:hypothetical protein